MRGGIHSTEGLSSGRTGLGAGLIQTRGEPGTLKGARLLLSLGLPRDTGSQSSHPREAQLSRAALQVLTEQERKQTDRQTERRGHQKAADGGHRPTAVGPGVGSRDREAGDGVSGILSGKGCGRSLDPQKTHR